MTIKYTSIYDPISFLKKIFLFVIFCRLFTGCLQAQDCYDLFINNQQQIDNFASDYPDCTIIGNNLTIEETTPGNIKNLNGLSQITSINGILIVQKNRDLEHLHGLENLTFVGDQIFVSRNSSLQDLAGLENITTPTHSVSINIGHNDVLTSLRGLENISIGRAVRIHDHDSLKNLDALRGLEETHSFFGCYDNLVLSDITGLKNLVSIGSHAGFLNNSALVSLDGLENLTHTFGGLSLTDNQNLSDLTALRNLTQIEGNLSISNNPQLFDLTGLDNIDPNSIEELEITACPNLLTCNVLSVCDYLRTGGPTEIFSNAEGCAYRVEVLHSCKTVGTTSPAIKLIQVLPNPTTGIVRINSTEEKVENIQVLNSIGKIVLSGANEVEFDLSAFADGLFFFVITNENQTTVKKVLKN